MASEHIRDWFLLWQTTDQWRFKDYRLDKEDRQVIFTLESITGSDCKEHRMEITEDEIKIVTCAITHMGMQAQVRVSYHPCPTSKPRHQEVNMSSLIPIVTGKCTECSTVHGQLSKFCSECGSNLKEQRKEAKKVTNKYLEWCTADIYTVAKRLLLGTEEMIPHELELFNVKLKNVSGQFYKLHHTDEFGYNLSNFAGPMSRADALKAMSRVTVSLDGD